jgi:hypothetical protein
LHFLVSDGKQRLFYLLLPVAFCCAVVHPTSHSPAALLLPPRSLVVINAHGRRNDDEKIKAKILLNLIFFFPSNGSLKTPPRATQTVKDPSKRQVFDKIHYIMMTSVISSHLFM